MTTAYNSAEVKEDVRKARAEFGEIRERAGEIGADFVDLAHQEMDLARAELSEARRHLTLGSASAVAGGIFVFWTVGFVGFALMFGIAQVWPDWAAALATAGSLLLVGGAAALIARTQFKQFDPIPRQTIQSVQEDISWLRRLMKRESVSGRSEP